jgi:hypothetical protein
MTKSKREATQKVQKRDIEKKNSRNHKYLNKFEKKNYKTKKIYRNQIGNQSLNRSEDLRELLKKVRQFANSMDQFELTNMSANKHEWGVGGYSLSTSVVLYKEIPILLIKLKYNYITTSDDFFDYESGTEITLELKSKNKKVRDFFQILVGFIGNLSNEDSEVQYSV